MPSNATLATSAVANAPIPEKTCGSDHVPRAPSSTESATYVVPRSITRRSSTSALPGSVPEFTTVVDEMPTSEFARFVDTVSRFETHRPRRGVATKCRNPTADASQIVTLPRGRSIPPGSGPPRTVAVPGVERNLLCHRDVTLRRVHWTILLAIAVGCQADDRGDNPVSGTAGASSGANTGADPSSSSTSDSTPGGDNSGSPGSAGSESTAGSGSDTTNSTTGATAGSDASSGDADTDSTTNAGSTGATDSDSAGGIVGGVLDIAIIAHNDCTFTVTPSQIEVPEGTEFTVNWISSAASEVEFDIAKIDPFNQVPIVIGMEPGSSYHDDIRQWCGTLFTGTFDFRLTSCYDPLYIPVDCSG